MVTGRSAVWGGGTLGALVGVVLGIAVGPFWQMLGIGIGGGLAFGVLSIALAGLGEWLQGRVGQRAITRRDIRRYRVELAQRGIAGSDADRLVENYRESGNRFVVTEADFGAYVSELLSAGVPSLEASRLAGEFGMTGAKPDSEQPVPP